MKIINQTKWDTVSLRKILQLCNAKLRKDERTNSKLGKKLTVKLIPHRTNRGWVGGYAPCYYGYIVLKLPKEYKRDHLTFEQSIADVFFHEIGHNLGVRHNGKGGTIEAIYRDWIFENITSDYKCVEKQSEPKNKIDYRLKRYEIAKNNLQTAITRLKRANTLFKKWKQKISYYEAVFAQKKEATPAKK